MPPYHTPNPQNTNIMKTSMKHYTRSFAPKFWAVCLAVVAVCFMVVGTVQAQAPAIPAKVKVRLMSEKTVKSFAIVPGKANYKVSTDRLTYLAFPGDSLMVWVRDGKPYIVCSDGVHVTADTIHLCPQRDSACVRLQFPETKEKRKHRRRFDPTFEGEFYITANKDSNLVIINELGLEDYIAAVSLCEMRGGQPKDVYLTMSYCVRTWTYRNLNRHAAEGYNFNDSRNDVPYLHSCTDTMVRRVIKEHSGEVLVDDKGRMIESIYHRNSGGETANSADVYVSDQPFLRSVPDSASLKGKNAKWNQRIARDKWLAYFAEKHAVDTHDLAIVDTLLHFEQPHRKARILNVRLKDVRSAFLLPSAWFSVNYDLEKNEVVLDGRGVGHGCGLSQQGMVQMVKEGRTPQEIIQYYYQGTKIFKWQ